MSTRREFITLLGGAAAGLPIAALAQQPERMRRVGVLMTTAADDVEGQARIAAFLEGLQHLGWTELRQPVTALSLGGLRQVGLEVHHPRQGLPAVQSAVTATTPTART